MGERRTFTVIETAKILGITKNRAYELIHSGVLKAFKCGRYMVSVNAINDFLQDYAGYDVSIPTNICLVK